MKRRGTASVANSHAKKWSGSETRELVEYAKNSGLGSPKSQSFWNDFPGCQRTGPYRRTPNSCKLRYMAVGPKIAPPAVRVNVRSTEKESTIVDICSDEDSRKCSNETSEDDTESVPDEDSSSQHSKYSQYSRKSKEGPLGKDEQAIPNETSSSQPSKNFQDSSKGDVRPVKQDVITSPNTTTTDSTGFHVTSEDLRSFLLMYNDVQRYASFPKEEIARNARNLTEMIRLIYNLARESDVDDLSDTKSQIKKLLSGKNEREVLFAKFTTFTVLNSHKFTKYYLMKENPGLTPAVSCEPGPVAAKDKRNVHYFCKVTVVTKDLKLIASTTSTQHKRVLNVVDEVYGDRIPGSNVVIAILSIDPKESIILGECYSKVDDILRIPCRLVVPLHLLAALQPKDVVVALDYQESGNYFVPCNPIAKCRRILIIKPGKFDKVQLLSEYQRKHGVLQSSNIIATTISIPIYTEHLQVEVKLDGTVNYLYKSDTCKTSKLVIMFNNDTEEVCSVEALSTVKYEYVKNFVVDGKSSIGWYAELIFGNSMEFKFNVKNLEENYDVLVCIAKQD